MAGQYRRFKFLQGFALQYSLMDDGQLCRLDNSWVGAGRTMIVEAETMSEAEIEHKSREARDAN
jgi:hypothetical protein